MPLNYSKKGNVIIVYPDGRFDIQYSTYLEREMAGLISHETGCNILFNMTAVEYVNSYGLKFIIKTCMTLKEDGRKLALCNLNQSILKLLDVIGSVEFLEIFNSEEPAVDYLNE